MIAIGIFLQFSKRRGQLYRDHARQIPRCDQCHGKDSASTVLLIRYSAVSCSRPGGSESNQDFARNTTLCFPATSKDECSRVALGEIYASVILETGCCQNDSQNLLELRESPP
jgi:hypothetical protein